MRVFAAVRPLLVGLALLSLAGRVEVAQGAVSDKPRVGAALPLDLGLVDERNSPVRLGDALGLPTVLVFADFRKPVKDDAVLSSLAASLGSLRLVAGRDYEVLTLANDPTATPDMARTERSAAIAAVGEPFPVSGWRFLVAGSGSEAALAELRATLGNGTGPLVLSPSGRLVQVLPGSVVVPLDLGMALMAASPRLLRRASASVLRFCLVYDAANRHYVLNILRVSGIVIFIFVAALVLLLLVSGGRRRRARAGA